LLLIKEGKTYKKGRGHRFYSLCRPSFSLVAVPGTGKKQNKNTHTHAQTGRSLHSPDFSRTAISSLFFYLGATGAGAGAGAGSGAELAKGRTKTKG